MSLKTKYFFAYLGIIAGVIVSQSPVVGLSQPFKRLEPRTNADTVQYREQIDMLPDGTRFAYELGGVGLISGHSIKYIRMTGDELDGHFINTESFELKSLDDSIRFLRWINFSKGEPVVFEGDTSDVGFATWLTTESDKALIPTRPEISCFNKHSRVRYILELRRLHDSSVLACLDTVSAYRNTYGALRWTHNLEGGSHSKVPVGKYVGAVVYLSVRREAVLPEGIHFTKRHEFTRFNRQSPMDSFERRGLWMGPLDR
jgi:hypothetical protein